MNAIFLKWLSMSLIGTVVLCALWLAMSMRGSDSSPVREAAAPARTTTVIANAR